MALEGVVADDCEDDEEVAHDDHDDEDKAEEEQHRTLNVAVGEVGVEEGWGTDDRRVPGRLANYHL